MGEKKAGAGVVPRTPQEGAEKNPCGEQSREGGDGDAHAGFGSRAAGRPAAADRRRSAGEGRSAGGISERRAVCEGCRGERERPPRRSYNRKTSAFGSRSPRRSTSP